MSKAQMTRINARALLEIQAMYSDLLVSEYISLPVYQNLSGKLRDIIDEEYLKLAGS